MLQLGARWAGREWALRQSRAEINVKLWAARESGDVDEGSLAMGQDRTHSRYSARRRIVNRIAREADSHAQASAPRHVLQ
jgi:hypothetical protein